MDDHLNPQQRIMSAPLTPQEMVMLSKQRWEDVRQMRAQGVSNSEIVRRLEIDRTTVRKALSEPWWAYSQARRWEPSDNACVDLQPGGVLPNSKKGLESCTAPS